MATSNDIHGRDREVPKTVSNHLLIHLGQPLQHYLFYLISQ